MTPVISLAQPPAPARRCADDAKNDVIRSAARALRSARSRTRDTRRITSPRLHHRPLLSRKQRMAAEMAESFGWLVFGNFFYTPTPWDGLNVLMVVVCPSVRVWPRMNLTRERKGVGSYKNWLEGSPSQTSKGQILVGAEEISAPHSLCVLQGRECPTDD